MTMMLGPGDHFGPDFSIAGHPAFQARPRKKQAPRTSHAELFFARVLHACQLLDRQGVAITAETIVGQDDALASRIHRVRELLETDKLRDALGEVGVELNRMPGLSPEQVGALSIYLNMGVQMTHSQKLRAIGISDAKWRGWLRQREFAAEYAALGEENLEQAKPIALQRLREAADRGEQWAVKFLLEVTGRHDPRKADTDPRALLLAVFSVLDEAGVDAETMGRVGAKVRAMMGETAAPAPIMQISPAVREPAQEEPT